MWYQFGLNSAVTFGTAVDTSSWKFKRTDTNVSSHTLRATSEAFLDFTYQQRRSRMSRTAVLSNIVVESAILSFIFSSELA
jgi:hypothetical protein